MRIHQLMILVCLAGLYLLFSGLVYLYEEAEPPDDPPVCVRLSTGTVGELVDGKIDQDGTMRPITVDAEIVDCAEASEVQEK